MDRKFEDELRRLKDICTRMDVYVKYANSRVRAYLKLDAKSSIYGICEIIICAR